MNRPASLPGRRLAAATGHRIGYAGLILFTILLYLRPNDVFPIGTFPIVKIMTIVTLAAFFVERIGQGGPLSAMPRPFKYLLIVAGLTILSIPVGLDPSTSVSAFTDVFLKTLLVFLLIINVVSSFRRLRLMMEVTVVCGAGVSVLTLVDYVQGKNLVEGYRATGGVGGIFGNPNDLALAMNVLLPLAVGLMLGRPHLFSKLLHGACATLMAAASVVTYSRAGVLTMVIAGAFFLVRVRHRYPAAWALGSLAGVALLASSPSRLFTLFDSSGGNAMAAGSAEARWDLVKRSVEVAGANPVRWMLGVGLENFHIVSTHEVVNHNAYLQVFNEVGLPALVFYVLFLVSVVRSSARVARHYRRARGFRQVWLTATAIQTSLIAYVVGSAFASVAFHWYVYYPAAFAVCLQQILRHSAQQPAQREVTPRVWYLRRVQH
jgi:O-antigen ligase